MYSREHDKLSDIENSVDHTNDLLFDIKTLLTEICALLKTTTPPSSRGVSVSDEGAAWASENVCGCRGLPGHAPGCALYRGGA